MTTVGRAEFERLADQHRKDDQVPAWEYLTINVQYERVTRTYTAKIDDKNEQRYGPLTVRAANPIEFLQNVLGPDGWELVAVDGHEQHFHGGANVTGDSPDHATARATRYWFKRAR